MTEIFMQIFVLFLLINLAFCFVAIKKYKNSTYYQITKTPYFSLMRDMGKRGEYLIYRKLKKFERDGAKFLFNVYIPKRNGETSEIDLLMIDRKGIFVFESKNYSGWIFGSETQRSWYQTLPSGKGKSHREVFYNPIMQNHSHIRHLKALIGDEFFMPSVIVFSERCTLKKVCVESKDIFVVKRNKVKSVVKKICRKTKSVPLTEEDVIRIYDQLYPYTQSSRKQRRQHIADIKRNLKKWRRSYRK